MCRRLEQIYEKALKEDIDFDDAMYLCSIEGDDIYEMIFFANKIRQKKKGNIIRLCSIVNAKCGKCPEDCIFCSQSIHHKTSISPYPLLEEEKIVEAAFSAKERGAKRFGIVTSGRRLTKEELQKVAQIARKIKESVGINVCASLGMIEVEELLLLKKAGVLRYNHNLEAAPSFFPKVCTTHTFHDRYRTAKNVKKAGLQLCCGGIFGLGEGWKERVELAFLVKEIEADAVPINIIHPIKGTRCEDIIPPSPLEILKILALFRFINPSADIALCGGREYNLKELQPLMYIAGANATLLGDYLTTKGRPPSEDIEIIKSLGLSPE